MVLLQMKPSIILHLFKVKVYGNKQQIKLFNKIHKIKLPSDWIILVQEFFNSLIQILNN